ncbi:hypothetical protein KIW84_065950 [Lathyrus oleraceus]|uniref:Uncharacterized protein n=1 Tax=Pisum sativum TaxID=3888 RepID=A0A9D4WGT9_PEA|nr:hypothetical protein KIW84_065950 [Pisum sativum]
MNNPSNLSKNKEVKYCLRPSQNRTIRLRIHHSGKLVETPVKPINCDAGVLKFIEDANVFELIDVYVEHAISNLEMIDDAKLVHDYAKEVHFNDEFAPNSDGDEVELDRVDDDVQVRSENIEDGVVSDTGYEHSDGIDDMDWTTLLPSDKLVDKVNNCNVDGDSDMLHTPPASDDEEEHERFPAYKSGEASNFN